MNVDLDPRGRSDRPEGAGRSAHRDNGNAFVARVSRDSLRARIEHRLAIDQELVMVVAVMEGDLRGPASIWIGAHGVRVGIPTVEISDDSDGGRACGYAVKIDRLHRPLGGKSVKATRGL